MTAGATSPRPPRWVWVALVALAALAAVYRSDDNDYWFHLAAGRSISQHGLPTQETWCLAARGEAPWLSEWLFHPVLYQVHRVAGDAGVAAWRAGWTAAAMALVVRLLFLLDAATWSAALVTPLAIAAARDRFQPRPEQLFIVFLLAALVAFEGARRTGRDRTRWLIPIQVFWANVQGSWVFGPAVAWVYAAAAWIEGRFRGGTGQAEGERPRMPRAARWAILGLVLWAASAIVPMPLETLARPFRFLVDMRVDPLTGSIQELRSWTWAQDRADPFTVLLGLWIIGLAVGGRRLWRASPGLFLMSLGGFTLGVLGVRFRGLAAWVGIAPLAIAWAVRGPRPARWALAAPPVGACVLGFFWLATAPQYTFGIHPQLYSVPVRAAALAESLHLEGPMYNTFHYGGYLLWVRGEKNPPLVDGRGRGSFAFRSLYARAHGDIVALDSLLEVYDFNYMIVEPPQSVEDRFAIDLSRRLEWARIFYDDAALLFVRWNRYPELARERAYRYFTPDYLEMTNLSERALADTGLGRLLEAELLRARAESPYHSRASLWLGLRALAGHDSIAAVRYLEEAYALAPAMPGLALRLGMAREAAGDRAGAIRAFREALKNGDDRPVAEGELELLEHDR